MFTLPVKFAHAGDGMGDVLDGMLDGGEIITRARAEVGLGFEQGFRIERDRRDGVVDIVGDAAGHLAEGGEAFLLHHRLLGLAQVVVCLLQRLVKLRLMRGEGDVFAELPEKFAFAAAESIGLPPGGNAARQRPGSPP